METDANTTTRHILPYQTQLCPNGKVAITNTSGSTVYLTRDEVSQQLARIDLDVHRRLMYEQALAEFPTDGPK